MKKIWILNHYATNMFFDESGRHYSFSEKLLEKGFCPTIFCSARNHVSNEHVTLDKVKYITKVKNNIPFVFIETDPYKGNGISRVRNMYSFYKNLLRLYKRYAQENGKPDVILASSVHPLTLLAGIKIAKYFNVPCISEIRDLWPEALFSFGKVSKESLFGKALMKGEYWIYKKSDALIFTKEGDTDYIIENKWDIAQGGSIDLRKTYYINNGVNLNFFNKSIEEHTINDDDLSDNKFKVVYAGSIRPVNNINSLVDVAILLKDYKDIQLLIYGEGNEREALESRVKNEKLSNIIFKGRVEKKYIPYILNQSSVNILNYSQEKYNWSRGNSSNKLFEYMAAGKPIISTVKMGYSPIIKYNIGFELEKDTPELLADEILKIYKMSGKEYLEISEAARDAAMEFDYQKLTEKLVAVIGNLGI